MRHFFYILTYCLAACSALGQLTATVSPGYSFSPGERPTVDTLNQLGRPTIAIAGTVSGSVGLAAGTVFGIHLNSNVADGVTICYDGVNHFLIICPGGVTSNQLAMFTIQDTNHAPGSITGKSIGVGQVGSTNITSGSISNLQIAANAAISTSKLALTAGTGISISGDTIAMNLVAGPGVTISGNTISSGLANSSLITLTGYGNDVTITHGLGGTPRIVRVVFVCQNATSPYQVGDEVDMSGVYTTPTIGGTVPSGFPPYAVSANATTVLLKAYGGVYKLFGNTQLVVTDWKVRVYYSL